MAALTEDACLREALDRMQRVEGFDVVIVCTGTEFQATFWQERLEAGGGLILPTDCVVLCVHEDWDGGAGNGLGTLYAWQKACALYASKGLERFAGGLSAALERGDISAALYHTAGKGTRLAPLPGAENNNKPGVKLPASLSEALGPLTILESVVKQTGVYGASRRGRLSVFWGDQIFVPTKSTRYDAHGAHADILCLLAPMPDKEEWQERGLDKYGLVLVNDDGAACQIEKVDHATAVKFSARLGNIAAVGTSLGSFSLSSALLRALEAEFDVELCAKVGQFDSDPHWWMPMTLPAEAYVQLMAKKSVPADAARAHHARVAAMLATFDAGTAHLLGPVDVGGAAYWWDYGQLALYRLNAARLVEDGVEADAMREFMNVQRGVPASDGLVSCARSCASASQLQRGRIEKSVLANVACPDVDASDCVLVNVTCRRLRAAKNSIAYNVVDDSAEGLFLAEGDVVTDVFQPDGTVIRQRSHLDVDGGAAWKDAVPPNAFSFEAIYKMNLETDIVATAKLAAAAHAALRAKL
ncbi:hypothetical protein M885DRAFT_518888 [Pelagophyceae sp. CCMP2097]|nr:hypothetical protein M885DRAFT_518888 [Pelagophyceae sp. CCMP2097]|mmetsp:Transcript_10728/g.37108  ORF Transcript_10728/g.37108 Transcript_10728/m.37108 type:complete len:528 (+) Transcript_10728:65-1648(+)